MTFAGGLITALFAESDDTLFPEFVVFTGLLFDGRIGLADRRCGDHRVADSCGRSIQAKHTGFRVVQKLFPAAPGAPDIAVLDMS